MSSNSFLPSYRPNVSKWTRPVIQLHPRTIIRLLKIVIPSILVLLVFIIFTYETHIEIAFYPRDWIRTEIQPLHSLAGCFNAARVSGSYNVTEALYGPRRTEVHTGMPLRMGLDCYDFAGTIQTPTRVEEDLPDDQRTHFHSYWRVDLAAFGPRQEYMLKSFFATQPLGSSKFILWSNGDLSKNPIIASYAARYPRAFETRVVDIPVLARGTALEGNEVLGRKDARAWVDGDLVRLLVVWTYGGVWVDMDSLLTRSLEPLLEHEFVTQWDCYDKVYQPMNGALMHFKKQSAYLCEAFHIMASAPPPRPGSTDWGSLLYLKLWRRLVAGSIPPFKVLPFCFSDARSCRLDNRLPDPFLPDGKGRGPWTSPHDMAKDGGLDQALQKVFAVHLHGQWGKAFPRGGWVERLLLNRYHDILHEGSPQ